MANEILKVVVFCHRKADDKDFTDRIICIPPSRAEYLIEELTKRADAGQIDTVQVGRVYIEATVKTPYVDECDKFLAKIDLRPHSSMNRATSSEDEDSGLIPDGASNETNT